MAGTEVPSQAKKGSSPQRIGRYQVLRKIATGGMAELFLAKQVGMEGFEKVVAIKRILSHLAHDEEFINMFRDEARIVAKLSHPNIVQIYDLGKAEDTYFIAMEYIPGRNLSSVAKRAKARGEKLPAAFIARCMAQACEGLHYAHTRKDLDGEQLHIVHRDVSPQNIIVGFSGQVKLVDFGIAKAATKIAHTRAGVLKGKYAYMSPEQIRGETIDARSDLFAVGIVLYELLCGRRPFEKDNSIQTLKAIVQEKPADPRAVNPDLPEGICQIIDKALSKKREERYQSAQEVQITLEDFVASSSERVNNVVISEWLQRLFAEELSKGKGATVVFKGIGEVILPDAEPRVSDDSGRDRPSTPSPDASSQEDAPPPVPVERSSEIPIPDPKIISGESPAQPLSNSSVSEGNGQQPVVLLRGRGGGSIEARPPIAAPSTRMPTPAPRGSSIASGVRAQLIEEGVIERGPDDPSDQGPSSFSDDSTTIAPPSFSPPAPQPAQPKPSRKIAPLHTESERIYEEGVVDREGSDPKALYDDSKTEFAPNPPPAAAAAIAAEPTAAVPVVPAAMRSAERVRVVDMSEDVSVDDSEVEGPTRRAGEIGAGDAGDPWAERTAAGVVYNPEDAAPDPVLISREDTTGVEAVASRGSRAPTRPGRTQPEGAGGRPGSPSSPRERPRSSEPAAPPASPISPKKRPAPAAPSVSRAPSEIPSNPDVVRDTRETRDPRDRAATDVPSREVSAVPLPPGGEEDWSANEDTGDTHETQGSMPVRGARASFAEPALPRPETARNDVSRDDRTMATSEYESRAVDIDVHDVEGSGPIEADPAEIVSVASGAISPPPGAKDIRALRLANAPTAAPRTRPPSTLTDDEDTMRPDAASFEDELDQLSKRAFSGVRRPSVLGPDSIQEAGRAHMSAELPKPPARHDSPELPPLPKAPPLPLKPKSDRSVQMTEQEPPLPPGMPARVSVSLPADDEVFAPKVPKPLAPSPLASIGSSKVPPANVSLSEMLMDAGSNGAASSGLSVKNRAGGMPRPVSMPPPSPPPVTPPPPAIGRPSKPPRGASVSGRPSGGPVRNIQERERPGSSLGAPPVMPSELDEPYGGDIVQLAQAPTLAKSPVGESASFNLGGGASLLGKIGTPVSLASLDPDLPPVHELAAQAEALASMPVPVPAPRANARKLQVLLIGLCLFVLAAVVAVVLYKTGGPTLVITTQPPGARVFLDDRLLPGETPLKVRGVERGKAYRVRVVSEGHDPVTQTVRFPESETTVKVLVTLQPAGTTAADPTALPPPAPADDPSAAAGNP